MPGDDPVANLGGSAAAVAAGQAGAAAQKAKTRVGQGIDAGQAGIYIPAPWCYQSNVALLANRAHFTRFVCPVSQSITKASFFVNTAAGANDNMDVGIFSADLNTLLGSSGSTAGQLNGTGIKTVNMLAPIPLLAGTIYYAAFSSGPQGGSAAQLGCAQVVQVNMYRLFGDVLPLQESLANAALFPLAAPGGGTVAATSTGSPLLALKQ